MKIPGTNIESDGLRRSGYRRGHTSFPDPPPEVPQTLNQPVLRSVTYTFVVVDMQGNELRYRGPRVSATITYELPRPVGTGGQEEATSEGCSN